MLDKGMLQKENMPVVAGGKREVAYLCGEWCQEVTIWCQATGEMPELDEILVKEYINIQKE